VGRGGEIVQGGISMRELADIPLMMVYRLAYIAYSHDLALPLLSLN